MSLAVLVAMLAAPSNAIVAPPAAYRANIGGKVCRKIEHQFAGPRKAPKANKLGELPAGELQLAVQREVGGCIEPVIVRQNVGGPRR